MLDSGKFFEKSFRGLNSNFALANVASGMANQIQGLKKAAAANRNKTKSQMRDSNAQISSQQATGDRSNAYRTKDSQNHRGDNMRQSAQTAMDTHGNMMNATTNLVGLRGQSKNENINTRSSSVARLHTNINAMNNNPNNHLSST